MEVCKGRPENCDGRLSKEIRVYDMLDRLGIEYYRVDHAPATKMEACRDIDRTLGKVI
jgi:Ala-tRNA(Pro) deacylase